MIWHACCSLLLTQCVVIDDDDLDRRSGIISANIDKSRPAVMVNERKLPHRITLAVNTAIASIPDADPIDFVLVLPGEVSIDGIVLEVSRPFYIAETELTQSQFAQLRYFGAFEEYQQFARSIMYEHRIEPSISASDLCALERYRIDPNLPALGVDVTDAAVVTDRLSKISGLRVRIPTIAEWFHAMRAEGTSRYWWGNNPVAEAIKISPRAAPTDCDDWLDSIRPVQQGQANRLGLKNMVGNVSELAIPSRAERETLWSRIHAEQGGAQWPTLSSHGGLALGASEFTLNGWAGYSPDELIASWKAILSFCQAMEAGEACQDINWTTGMRLLVEVPLGSVTIDDQNLKDSGAP